MTLRRIDRDQARMGMFVHAFDGSWFGHPFWRTRFVIDSPAQLVKLLESDVFGLVIDEARGVALEPMPPLDRAVHAPHQAGPDQLPVARPPAFDRSDRAEAARCLRASTRAMRQLMTEARTGRQVAPADVRPLVDALGRSLERSPRALLGLARL